ncbi:hypothetical protein V6N13_088937 [Hibiscus sabdariffa]
MKQFDGARLLLQVQRVSSIPDRLSVTIKGITHQIKIVTEVYEEERMFIDGESPHDHLGVDIGSDSDFASEDSTSMANKNEVVVFADNKLRAKRGRKIVADRMIVLIGKINSYNFEWGLVNIYAPNSTADREVFFNSLSNCLDSLRIPVILGGDFDIVKIVEEKIGVAPKLDAMKSFCNFIQKNDMMDLPLVSNLFTWYEGNGRTVACKQSQNVASVTLRAIKGAVKSWVRDFRENDIDSIPLLEKKIVEIEDNLCADGYNANSSMEIQELQSKL